jgi:hypothetical protein
LSQREVDKLSSTKHNYALVPVSTSHVSDKIVFRAIEKVDLESELRRLKKIPTYSKPAIAESMLYRLHKLDHSQISTATSHFGCIADD